MHRAVTRLSAIRRAALSLRGGGHHGPALPPFARQPLPTQTLPEEVELVWDDTVAPETALDIEVPHISAAHMFYSMGAMALFILSIAGLTTWANPEKNSPVALRREVIPYGGLKKELGELVEEE